MNRNRWFWLVIEKSSVLRRDSLSGLLGGIAALGCLWLAETGQATQSLSFWRPTAPLATLHLSSPPAPELDPAAPRPVAGTLARITFPTGSPTVGAVVIGTSLVLVLLGGYLCFGWVRRRTWRRTDLIHKEKNLLATLIDQLPDNVFVKDTCGRYVLTNKAHTQYHGASSRDCHLGKRSSDFLPPDLARAYEEIDAKILSGSLPTYWAEEPGKDGQGRENWLLTTKVPLRNASGEIIGLVGISRDITERKRSEEELLEKERVLSTLMSNLPGMAYRCRNDKDWTMEFLSEGCFELTGYRPADLIDNAEISFAGLILPGDREMVWRCIQQSLAERKKYQIYYRIRSASGMEKWVWEQGLGVFDDKGELRALEGFIADITERKQAEQRLSAFSTLGQKLSAAQTARAAAEIVAEVADQLLGWDACVCSLYSSEEDILTHVLTIDSIEGRRTEFRPDDRGPQPPSPLMRRALREGAQLVLRGPSDLTVGELRPFGDLTRLSASLILAPIRNGKDVIGIVSAQSYKPHAYDSRSLETLQALADHCGGALDRIRVEEKLMISEQFTRSLVESLPQNIMRKDLSGRFTFVNKVFCRTIGKPMCKILGKTDFDLYPPELAAKFREDDEQVIANGKLFATVEENRSPSGERSYVEVFKTPVFDGSNRPAGLQVVFWDVTPRKRAEAQLAYERDLLRALLDNYPDAIYFKDLQSRFVRVSRSKLERSFALARTRHALSATSGESGSMPPNLESIECFTEDMIGKTDFDFFEESRAREAYNDEQEIIRTGTPIIGKIERALLPGGKIYWSLSTKMPWRDKDGEVIGTFGISKDITSIKEAEAKLEQVHKQLIETSRQAGMAEVATQVLHNVGNVLNSVNVSATLVTEKVRRSRVASLSRAVALFRDHSHDLGDFIMQDPKGRHLPAFLGQLAERLVQEQSMVLEELASLAKNIEHIKTVIAMQQSYSKIAGITELIDPADVVEDALRIHTRSLAHHNIEIIRDYAPNLPHINVEKHKVLQILVNLISNAKHACAESGREERKLTVRAANGEGSLKFMVQDNGVGIPPENLTRIFNFGFTTRKQGHGFGLHSGALAAREMGGALRVHSDGPGQGAVFTLELPVARAAADGSTVAGAKAQA